MTGRQSQKQGFTIIETMLALAISSLMLVGIIASVSSSLSAQRYRDAVQGVVSYLQGQYNLASNTRNDRNDQSYCGSGALLGSAVTRYRGSTDCTIVGRLLRGEGDTIISFPLYATVDINTITTTDTKQALLDAKIAADTSLSDDYTLEWGARLYKKGGTPGVNERFTMMILRSPFTGAINTFIDPTSNTATITGLINNGASLSTSAELCVEASGGMFNVLSGTLGVKVDANSSNASGVAKIGDEGGC